MHQAMTELHWTPEQLGKLTLPQLVCLVKKEPPSGSAMGPNDAADPLEYLKKLAEAEAEAEKAWRL